MKKIQDFPALIQVMDSYTNWDTKMKESFGTCMIAIADTSFDLVTIISRAHLLSETYLNKYINHFFKKGSVITNDSIKFSFSKKLDIIDAGEWLTEELIASLKALNKVRNACAHEFGYCVTVSDINKIGKPFSTHYDEMKKQSGSDMILLQNVLLVLFASLEGQLKQYSS